VVYRQPLRHFVAGRSGRDLLDTPLAALRKRQSDRPRLPLHIRSLLGIRRIRTGGWIVIEDIPARALPVWKVVGSILPTTYATIIIQAQNGFVFAAQRTC
jgi:hypothetical protein